MGTCLAPQGIVGQGNLESFDGVLRDDETNTTLDSPVLDGRDHAAQVGGGGDRGEGKHVQGVTGSLATAMSSRRSSGNRRPKLHKEGHTIREASHVLSVGVHRHTAAAIHSAHELRPRHRNKREGCPGSATLSSDAAGADQSLGKLNATGKLDQGCPERSQKSRRGSLASLKVIMVSSAERSAPSARNASW